MKKLFMHIICPKFITLRLRPIFVCRNIDLFECLHLSNIFRIKSIFRFKLDSGKAKVSSRKGECFHDTVHVLIKYYENMLQVSKW